MKAAASHEGNESPEESVEVSLDSVPVLDVKTEVPAAGATRSPRTPAEIPHEKGLPRGWSRHRSSMNGREYYVNAYSGETQWAPPDAPANPLDKSQTYGNLYAERVRSQTRLRNSVMDASDLQDPSSEDQPEPDSGLTHKEKRWALVGAVAFVVFLAVTLGAILGASVRTGHTPAQAAEAMLNEMNANFLATASESGTVELDDSVLGRGSKVSELVGLLAPRVNASVGSVVTPKIQLTNVLPIPSDRLFSELTRHFPAVPLTEGFGAALAAGFAGKSFLYSAETTVYGQNASCIFGLIVSNQSTLVSVDVGLLLKCNLSNTVVVDQIYGLSSSDALAFTSGRPWCSSSGGPEVALATDAFAAPRTPSSASNDGTFQLAPGLNMFARVQNLTGQLSQSSYFARGQDTCSGLRALVPKVDSSDISGVFFNRSAGKCPDVQMDVSYLNGNLSVGFDSQNYFKGKNVFVRALDGQLACNPDNSTFGLAFELETAEGHALDLNMSVTKRFTRTADVDEHTFSVAAQASKFALPEFSKYIRPDTSRVTANVTFTTDFKTFRVDDVYINGYLDFDRLGVRETAFVGKYLASGDDEWYGVTTTTAFGVSGIDSLICTLTSQCGSHNSLSGMLVDGQLTATLTVGNTLMVLGDQQVLPGVQVALRGGLQRLPDAFDDLMALLGNPVLDGSLGVYIPYEEVLTIADPFDVSRFVVWARLEPFTPPFGGAVAAESSVLVLEQFQLDVYPVQATVRATALARVRVGSQYVHFEVGGGLRSGTELYITGKLTAPWHNVAGIRGLTISKAGLELGIVAGPTVSTVGVWAVVKLGAAQANGTIYFSGTQPDRFVLMATLADITANNLLAAAEDIAGVELPGVAATALTKLVNFRMHTVRIHVAPRAFILNPTSSNPTAVEAGFKVFANMSLFGANLVVDMNVRRSSYELDMFGSRYTVPDVFLNVRLLSLYASNLIPDWNVASQVIQNVRDRILSSRLLSTILGGILQQYTLSNTEIDNTVSTIQSGLDSAIGVNEFSITQLSVYNLTQGRAGRLRLDINIAGFNLLVEEDVDLDFFESSSAQTVAWLRNAVTRAITAVRNVAAQIQQLVEAIIRHWKSTLQGNLCHTFSVLGISRQVCIDFPFW